MDYIDGFVVAVPTARRADYLKHAANMAEVLKENGALRVVECWGDDVPTGKVTSFPQAVKLEPNETVAFSWIAWPSRQARDSGMKKAMDDPRMKNAGNNMPFDGKRMIFGGFEQILDS
jgi:uncharacterized protein YbaA (DUF1428 family)